LKGVPKSDMSVLDAEQEHRPVWLMMLRFCDSVKDSGVVSEMCVEPFRVGGKDQSEIRLPGFPYALERCGPRHSRPEASQSGVREAAVIPTLNRP
jgi:hypothetical protein